MTPITRPLGDIDPRLLEAVKEVRPVKVEGTQNATKIDDHSDNSVNKTMPWLVLCGIISGVALGLAIGARDNGLRAERETRLMRLEVDELKVALQVQGIKIHEGSTP